MRPLLKEIAGNIVGIPDTIYYVSPGQKLLKFSHAIKKIELLLLNVII